MRLWVSSHHLAQGTFGADDHHTRRKFDGVLQDIARRGKIGDPQFKRRLKAQDLTVGDLVEMKELVGEELGQWPRRSKQNNLERVGSRYCFERITSPLRTKETSTVHSHPTGTDFFEEHQRLGLDVSTMHSESSTFRLGMVHLAV